MVDIEWSARAKSDDESVNTMPVHKGKKTIENLARELDEVTTANEKTLETHSKEQLSFYDKYY